MFRWGPLKRGGAAIAGPLTIGRGANRVTFDSDGSLMLEGDATVWRDITGDINGSNLYSAAGKADYDYAEGLIVLQPGGSISTAGDVIIAKYQLQHAHQPDSNLKPHIHWRQPSAGAYQFAVSYRLVGNNGSASTTAWSAPATVTVGSGTNAFPYVSGNLDQITMLPDIPTTGWSISSIFQIKLARVDAVAGDLYIYDVDCHYLACAMGSRTEYTL